MTVFGFSLAAPEQLDAVLDEMRKLGTVLEATVGRGGNWLVVRFASFVEASLALSKQRLRLDAHTLVGVLPFAEEHLQQTAGTARQGRAPHRTASHRRGLIVLFCFVWRRVVCFVLFGRSE